MDNIRVECGICHMRIKGFRYTCLECEDYDLCSSCEPKFHSGHLLIRFTNAVTQFDGKFLKEIIRKRSQDKVDLNSHETHNYVVGCDNCGRKGIEDFIYKCVECPNMDLCRRCEKKHVADNHLLVRFANLHDFNDNLKFWREILKVRSSMLEESFKQELPVHKHTTCNVCDNTIIGIRFKCIDCPDFNLCSLCETTNYHSGHLIVRIATPLEANSTATSFLIKLMQIRTSSYVENSFEDDNEEESSLLSPEYHHSAIRHNDILCDVCANVVVGFRYKCVDCSDYDLCSLCQRKGCHIKHLFIRFAEPLHRNAVNEKFLETAMKIRASTNQLSSLQPRQENNSNGNVEGRSVPDCAICFEKPSEMILLDCGHLCICSECIYVFSRHSAQCPICRATVKAMHRAYY